MLPRHRALQLQQHLRQAVEDAMAMLLASQSPVMEAYRVNRAVNTPRNNTEGLLEPVA